MQAWPQQVLVGVDGSAGTDAAVAFGRVMSREAGADVTLAAVFGRGSAFPGLRSQADAAAVLERAGDLRGFALEAASPARGLQEAGAGADLVVLGSSHRRPAGRVYPGSTAERLLACSHRPLAVAPAGFEEVEDPGLRVLGIGYDGTPEAHDALRRAEQLAETIHGTLRVYAVLLPAGETSSVGTLAPEPPVGAMTRDLQESLVTAVGGLDPAVRALPVTLRGDSVAQLLDHAEEVDALVVGARRQGRLARIVAGSVGAALMAEAQCPVIVVPPIPNGLP